MTRRLASATLLALSLLAACAATPAPEDRVATDQTPPGAAAPIHVTLAVAPDAFAPDGEIRVEVWNPAQLARREQARACVVRIEGATCPGGAPYAPPIPETHTFHVSDLARPLQFDAASLRPGEPYEISLVGRARDPLAHVVGTTRGVVASSARVTAAVSLSTNERRRPPGS